MDDKGKNKRPGDDAWFAVDRSGLEQALQALIVSHGGADVSDLPVELPDMGVGEASALDMLAPIVIGKARALGAPDALAHMDPPTPWISWAMALWNASLNQNLLHPDLSLVATEIEKQVIDWLAPVFGMDGGHMVPGSSIGNLTGLWAARELAGVRTVVASDAAHLSVAKAAHLLGLEYVSVGTDAVDRLDARNLPADMSDAALVLTAGTTSAGAIDDLGLIGRAAWAHVDAAWAGPLRLSDMYGSRLNGIERADSISISAHKLLFQPKENALVLFRDTKAAHGAVSFGGAYLATPNVGVMGSRGASAVPLLAWGRTGMAARIERVMGLADDLWRRLDSHPGAVLYGPQQSGVILWRPHSASDIELVLAQLPVGSTSTTKLDGQGWLRNVAANPNADIDLLWDSINRALG